MEKLRRRVSLSNIQKKHKEKDPVQRLEMELQERHQFTSKQWNITNKHSSLVCHVMAL